MSKRVVIVITLITSIFSSIYAQTSSMNDACLAKISTYKEYAIKKYYEDAYTPWLAAFNDCPDASKNIYIDGVKIMKYFIKKYKNEPEKQQMYFDSLMLVYDTRIEYYQQEGFVLGLKGIDILLYRKNNVEDAYNCLKRSVELEGDKSKAAFINTFMQASRRMFQLGKISSEDVVDNFMLSMEILEKQKQYAMSKTNMDDFYQYLEELDSLNQLMIVLNTEPLKNKMEIRETERKFKNLKKTKKLLFNLDQCGTAITNIENIFAKSGAASCDNLTEIFTPKFEENSEDIDFLKKLTKILDKNECTDCELYSTASGKLFELDPSAIAAYNIAKLYYKKKEYNKAVEYYQNAIKNEGDDLAKAQYYYELSATYLKISKYREAKTAAYEAVKRNRNWGKPYIVIAMAYSGANCGENDFEKKAIYWAAVDKLNKAIAVDPSIASQVDPLISSFSQQFPNNEDAFFHGFVDGNSYTIGCWVNETTTVRTLKK